jgi:hypothetical protein
LAGDSSIFNLAPTNGVVAPCTFTNFPGGTVIKPEAGTAVLGGVPQNNGTVHIDGGDLTLLNTSSSQTATSTGTFDVAAGATLGMANLGTGSVVLGPTSVVSGAGTLDATYEGQNSGTDTIMSSSFAPADLSIEEGTMDLSSPGPLTFSDVTIGENGGRSELEGTTSFTVDKALVLDGGPTLTGTGLITIASGATGTVDGASTVSLGTEMDNNGNLTLASAASPSMISCAGGGVIKNYNAVDLIGASSISPFGCVVDQPGGTVTEPA